MIAIGVALGNPIDKFHIEHEGALCEHLNVETFTSINYGAGAIVKKAF